MERALASCMPPPIEIPRNLTGTIQFARPPGLPVICSDTDLFEAVKASIAGVPDDELAPILGVKTEAVKYWVSSKEWTAIKEHVLPQMKGLFHTQLCGIRSSIIQKLGERVRLGDPMYNNLGEPVMDQNGKPLYRPIKGKELSGMLVQVRDVISSLEEEIGVKADTKGHIELDDLALALANLAKPKQPTDISGQSQRIS